MSLIRYTAPSLGNYLAGITPTEKKIVPVEPKSAPTPEAPKAPGDSVDIQPEPVPTTPAPGSGGGHDGDEVPSDDDGPGAGGGYDRDAIPADDDGPGKGRKGPGPAESDGPGAGGGYASITGMHHSFNVGPITEFWSQPFTVFNATANTSATPSYLPLSSFNDYASYLLQSGPEDTSKWTQNGQAASPPNKASVPVKKADGKQ